MDIIRIGTEAEHWKAYLAHLKRTNMAQWVVDDQGRPGDSLLFLGAFEGAEAVGNLVLRDQPISVPPTEWSGGKEQQLDDSRDDVLRETFVMTFAVDEVYRRRGIGRALQAAALRWTAEQGCWQMRSWSSLDKPENYALKLSLGFAMHPAVHDAAGGYQVSGVYFVKHVGGNS